MWFKLVAHSSGVNTHLTHTQAHKITTEKQVNWSSIKAELCAEVTATVGHVACATVASWMGRLIRHQCERNLQYNVLTAGAADEPPDLNQHYSTTTTTHTHTHTVIRMCEWVFIVCTKEAAPAISFLSCCFPFNAFSACNFVYCRCCCCLFRMQFYGHISNAHLALHFPFRRPQHPLLPLLQLCNTRILFGKILHFALRNWFGQQFSRHLRWVPFWGIDLVIILITMGIFNPARTRLGFYCIRINNCIGHKCGGRGWDSSIAIIYISFGQQQKATQHCS